MTYQGHIEDGFVVLDEQASLPNGTKVQVAVCSTQLAAVEEHGLPTLYDRLKSVIGIVDGPPDLKRCQIMARIIALIYNWWSLYVRLAIPERHAEAITSRPLLLYGVGQQTRHGGQTTITITPMHAQRQTMQTVLMTVNEFLSEVKATARQLDWNQRWRTILSRIFTKILKGRPLASPNLLPVPT